MLTSEPLRVISLGAGVQSTAMTLAAAHGEIGPMPDCAIFADTGWEPKAVYEHLAWLRSLCVIPFPIHVVSAGDLRADVLRRSNTTGGSFAAVPWYMQMPNGDARGNRPSIASARQNPVLPSIRSTSRLARRWSRATAREPESEPEEPPQASPSEPERPRSEP